MKEKTRKILQYIVDRMKEPSSWAGFGIALVGLAPRLGTALSEIIAVVGPLAAGVLAIVLAEGG